MEAIDIIPDLTKQGFKDGEYTVTEYKGSVTIGGMPEGTTKGNPIVMIGLEQPDGSILVVQITLALFLSAADALRVKYGDPRQ